MDRTKGLTCPECSGVVPVKEGARIVACPSCGIHALIQGDHGVRRWQVSRRVDRKGALQNVKRFLFGIKKAADLKKEARIIDTFLVYLPYWQVYAGVAGWRFGRRFMGSEGSSPVETRVLQQMYWLDAALDVSEYGAHRVSFSPKMLELYDSEALHAEALILEPTETHTDARKEAHKYFMAEAMPEKHHTAVKYFEKVYFLGEQLSIVYYPLWVTRYTYHKRHYQVVVDGVSGEVLYGKAPGNILFPVMAMVGSVAIGNLFLVLGMLRMVISSAFMGDIDNSRIIYLGLIILGLGFIYLGYKIFRYGEEVEQISRKAKKANPADMLTRLTYTFSRIKSSILE